MQLSYPLYNGLTFSAQQAVLVFILRKVNTVQIIISLIIQPS